MYARFVSVFEFRIQMAHLPESGWVTGLTGEQKGEIQKRRMGGPRGRKGTSGVEWSEEERSRVEVVRV